MYIMTKTITVNVDDEVEAQFRKLVRAKYGTRKGSLGRAFGDALRYFIKHRSEDADAELMRLGKHGFNFGGMKVKDRGAWHER